MAAGCESIDAAYDCDPSILSISDRVLEACLTATKDDIAVLQRLIADIAQDLGRSAPEALDDAIVTGLRTIVETLRLDGAAVWRGTRALTDLVVTHQWLRDPDDPVDPRSCLALPWMRARLEAGEIVFADAELESAVSAVFPIPSCDPENVLSAVTFSSTTTMRQWPSALVELLRMVVAVIGQALANKEAGEALRSTLDEIDRLRERRPKDEIARRPDQKPVRGSRVLVSDSAAMEVILGLVEQVAPTPATVLLLGETGSGKEVIAQTIHDLSPRRHRPMVKINCAAIPAELIESELFGRERGAYTGALTRQIGRFEVADRSTIFLDEVGELPPEIQVKLLRVLQERTIERLGSTQVIKLDVRIIAATNTDLEKAVEEKKFREDLFFRLNVFPIVAPSLRERPEDIPALVWTFMDEFSKSFGKRVESISKEAMHDLQRYAWPGNVRELRNVIERAVIMSSGPELEVSTPASAASRTRLPHTQTLVDREVEHIRTVLEMTNWRIRGTGGAAERLAVKPTTLESRMARLGISRKSA